MGLLPFVRAIRKCGGLDSSSGEADVPAGWEAAIGAIVGVIRPGFNSPVVAAPSGEIGCLVGRIDTRGRPRYRVGVSPYSTGFPG